MRVVVQRVSSATVRVNGNHSASIGTGIVALVGIHRDDTDADMEYIIRKILGVRIFDDKAGVMNLSITDVEGELLLVSQFTLYGDARKGKRPSYSDAMRPELAAPFFSRLVAKCKMEYTRIKCGVFGAFMEISLLNSGPVTILFDSSKLF